MKTARAYVDGGWRPCLFKRGRKNLLLVHRSDSANGVKTSYAPLTVERYFLDVFLKGEPYPSDKMAKAFRKTGRQRGITKAARKALRGV